MTEPTLPPSKRRFRLYWLPAGGVTLGLLTAPNVVAPLQGGLSAPGVGDFALHVVAYLVICFLWWRVLRTAADARVSRWAAPLAVAVALGVGAIDEALQAIPALHRTCSWRDFLADCLGCALASLLATEAARIGRGKSKAG